MMIEKISKRILACAIAVIAGTVFADKPAVEPFVIAEDGLTKSVIVVHKDAPKGAQYAAKELSSFLERISGAPIMIADEPLKGYNTILVGSPYKAGNPEEICIRVKDAKTLEITGDRSRGIVYAAYEFLEYLGVVFCTRDYDYVPTIKKLEIPGDFKLVDAPFMYAVRSTWSDTGWYDFKFATKLRYHVSWKSANSAGYPDLARDYENDYNHAVTVRWISRKKYAATHPEWFAYIRSKDPRNYNGENGEGISAQMAAEVSRKARNYNWVCISNEEMWKTLLAEIGAFLEKNPNRRELSIAIGDCADYCECEGCTKLVRDNLDPDGSEVYSVQVYILANRIGKHFADKYPNLRFNLLPYGDRQPQNFPLEKNIGGCSAELWRNHCLPADCNERSKGSLAAFCNNVTNPKNGTYVWEYLANFRDWMIPYPNMYIMGGSMRYYKRLGIRGVSTQHQFSGLGDLSEMKLWLHAKLHWNPDADVDALIDKYCNAAYGPAAKYVKEYITLVEHARLRQRWTWYGCYVPDTSHHLSDADCIKIYRAMQNALGAVRGNTTYLPRVRRAAIPSISIAIWRYQDILPLAPQYRIKLPTLEQLYHEWYKFVDDSANARYHRMFCEGGADYGKRITNMFKYDIQPTNRAPNRAVLRIPAKEMTGGKRMTLQRDKDGTEFAQIKVALRGEPESIWMNTRFAEIGYSAKLEDSADWYVFATVRLGTTVDGDPSSAYMGIYQFWYPNGIRAGGRMEVANQAIVGRLEDKGKWQTVCLGKRRISLGSRIWVMPGVLHPCDYIDVKEFTLVDPALIEKTTNPQVKK